MKYNKQNFVVTEIGDYITLTMDRAGIVDYFTRNQTFLDILKHYKPSLEIDKQQRIRAVFYMPDEDRHDKKYFIISELKHRKLGGGRKKPKPYLYFVEGYA